MVKIAASVKRLEWSYLGRDAPWCALSNFAHDSICTLPVHYSPKPSCRAQVGCKPELLRLTCALGFNVGISIFLFS